MPFTNILRIFLAAFVAGSIHPGAFAAQIPPLFPKPDAEKAFSELKIYDAHGRPWRAAIEDWDGARHRVANDSGWSSWLKGERQAVDRWITRHQDRVAWVAGWSHDFVSPKDGSHLVWTEDIPLEEVPFLHSPSDPRVEVTPKIMASWVVAFRGQHAEVIRRAARLYRLTGDPHYADWVKSQIDFYADHFTEWAPTRDGARLYWQTLTEASHVLMYVEAVRQLGDAVTPGQKQRWRARFFQPEADVLNKNFQEIHNIATWQRCSVAQIALLYGDEALWHRAIDGPFGLREQMDRGITSDYIWWEQSLGYNNFVVEAVLTLFNTAGVYGRAQELAPEMTVAENLLLAPVYLRFPDGHLPNPADNAGLPKTPDRGAFANAYRVFPTPIALAEIAGRRNWETLLDPPPPPPPHADRLPEVPSRNMESSREAIIRSGKWQVFFQYGQLARQHAQSEALNYSAYYGSVDITHDAGTVGYGSPLHKGYYTRGAAQNELLVDGEGEVPPQRGELLTYSAEEGLVSAAQPNYRPDARAERALKITGDSLVDTATVSVKDGSIHKLGLSLHLQGHPRLSDSFQPDPGFAQGRPAPFGYWRDVTAATFHDQAQFDVQFEGVVMRVTLAAPGDFKLWHGTTPDSPPRRRDTLYAETSGSKVTFTTTYAPAAPRP